MSRTKSSSRAKLAFSTLAAACLWATAQSAGAAIPEPVRLDAGLLGGSIESAAGIREFRGIPFAAAPVDDLRWREPQAVPRWEGVRSAAEFGNVCMQPDGGARGNIALLPEGIGMSEDCLYLNVWTGAESASERRPVMMYIYGGAYSEGAGSAPLYNGTELAKKGAVVVTMNYRLGALGFFAHPALTEDSPNSTSGNYGIMDMLAALEWIQANIEQFGGDPNNVTVFGQSAGAMAIGTLVASPKAAGLFHRAISQSGTWMGLNMSTTMGTREQMEQRGKTAADNMGATTAAELRALSTEQALTLPASGNFIVDGYLLPENATDIFVAGRQNKVDVLTGSNKDELSFSMGGPRGGGAGRGGPRAGGPGGPGGPRAGGPGGPGAARGPGGPGAGGPGAAPGGPGRGGPGGPGGGFAGGGRGGPGGPGGAAPGRGGPGGPGAGGPGGGAAAGGPNAQNDGPFWVSRFFADKQLEVGNTAWLYYFAQNPPGPDGTSLGAVHASEVPYVFNNLGQQPLFPDTSNPQLSAASADDQKVADLMSSYWVNFARTGDPNGPGLATWRPHEIGNSDTAIILDAHPETETLPPKERLEAIDERFNAALAGN